MHAKAAGLWSFPNLVMCSHQISEPSFFPKQGHPTDNAKLQKKVLVWLLMYSGMNSKIHACFKIWKYKCWILNTQNALLDS